MSTTTNTAIPKLRFPEFEQARAGEEKTLGEVCESVNSGKDKVEDNGNFNLYGSTGIIGKSNSKITNGTYILIARVGANAGQLNKVTGEFGVTDNTLIVKLKQSINLSFVFYLLSYSDIKRLVFGSGQPLITGGQLKNLPIPIPTLHEQKKIADTLSSLDELITANNVKLEALKTHKQGLMQQLFPAAGEKVPRLRFPEFANAGDWEEKTLGEVTEYEQPNDYLVKSTEYNNNYQTPVLTAGKTFILGYTNEITGIYNKNLPVIIFDDFTTSTQFVDFPFKSKSSAMKIITANKSFNIKFIFELLQDFEFEVGIHGRHWISIFSKLHFPFPTLPEQEKIAACLSSLDKNITAQSQKIEVLQVYKKGLMQRLFPTF